MIGPWRDCEERLVVQFWVLRVQQECMKINIWNRNQGAVLVRPDNRRYLDKRVQLGILSRENLEDCHGHSRQCRERTADNQGQHPKVEELLPLSPSSENLKWAIWFIGRETVVQKPSLRGQSTCLACWKPRASSFWPPGKRWARPPC